MHGLAAAGPAAVPPALALLSEIEAAGLALSSRVSAMSDPACAIMCERVLRKHLLREASSVPSVAAADPTEAELEWLGRAADVLGEAAPAAELVPPSTQLARRHHAFAMILTSLHECPDPMHPMHPSSLRQLQLDF